MIVFVTLMLIQVDTSDALRTCTAWAAIGLKVVPARLTGATSVIASSSDVSFSTCQSPRITNELMPFKFLLYPRAYSANAEHISTICVHDGMSMFDRISQGHRVRSQRDRARFETTSITREFKLRFSWLYAVA